MVKQSGMVVEFESIDGTHIELVLKVTDPQGDADLVAQTIIGGIERFVEDLDRTSLFQELVANGIEIVDLSEVPAILDNDPGDENDYDPERYL